MKRLEEVIFNHRYDEDSARLVRDGISNAMIITIMTVAITILAIVAM